MLQQIEALLDNQGAPSPSAGGPKTGHCWLTLGVVFGWTLGGCACGLRCPVNPSSLGWGRSFAEDFFRRGLSLPSGPLRDPFLRRTSLRNGLV